MFWVYLQFKYVCSVFTCLERATVLYTIPHQQISWQLGGNFSFRISFVIIWCQNSTALT